MDCFEIFVYNLDFLVRIGDERRCRVLVESLLTDFTSALR